MLAWVKKLLEPPVFPGDEEKTSRARTFNTMGLYFVFALIIATVLYIPLFATHKLESWAIILGLFAAYMVSRFLLFRGQLNSAGLFLITMGWITCMGVALLGGGLSSPMMFALAAITIAVGLLFRARVGFFFLLLNVLLGLIFAFLQELGMYPPRYFMYSAKSTWFYFTLSLVFINWTINLTVRKLEGALEQMRQQNEEIKRTEMALRESEERFRVMFEKHNAIMLLIEPASGRIIDANLSAVAFYGYPRDSLRAMNIGEINMLDAAEIAAEQEQAIRQERNYFIFPHRLANGEARTVEVRTSPIEAEGRQLLFSIIQDITKRQRAEDALRHLSTHDILTGVFNRAFFEAELERLESSCEFPISIIVADLDNMKITNDTFGHVAGDELLKRATQVLQSTFRASDILSRTGGDEFAALLLQTDAETVGQMLNRIRVKVDEYNAANSDLPVQLSLGAFTAARQNLMTTFVEADRRMYADKAARKKNNGIKI